MVHVVTAYWLTIFVAFEYVKLKRSSGKNLKIMDEHTLAYFIDLTWKILNKYILKQCFLINYFTWLFFNFHFSVFYLTHFYRFISICILQSNIKERYIFFSSKYQRELIMILTKIFFKYKNLHVDLKYSFCD